MAYIADKWLDRSARQARIKLVETRISKLERLREHGTLMETQVRTLIADKKELVKLRRIHRSEYDVLYFGMAYFSEDGNPGNADNLVPEGVNVSNAAKFHRELTDMLDEVTEGYGNGNVVWACPRRG